MEKTETKRNEKKQKQNGFFKKKESVTKISKFSKQLKDYEPYEPTEGQITEFNNKIKQAMESDLLRRDNPLEKKILNQLIDACKSNKKKVYYLQGVSGWLASAGQLQLIKLDTLNDWLPNMEKKLKIWFYMGPDTCRYVWPPYSAKFERFSQDTMRNFIKENVEGKLLMEEVITDVNWWPHSSRALVPKLVLEGHSVECLKKNLTCLFMSLREQTVDNFFHYGFIRLLELLKTKK